jgi:CHRD domain
MRKRTLAALLVPLAVLALVTIPALADDDDDEFRTRLSGYLETPQSISTTGRGDFRAELKGMTLEYRLSYEGLEGGAVSAAHIHLGQKATTGGVIAFLCGGGDKPACPQQGTVRGVIDPADVIGPSGQGIAPGEFAELVRALRQGFVYANVHTQTYPGGEIRGQVREDD